MIDIHCHILWGVDDASRVENQALDMLHIAVADGVKVIVATSHIKYPIYPNTLESLQVAYQSLQDVIQRKQLPIQIILGAENFVNHKTIQFLKENKFVSFNNENKYILIEFAWTKNMFDHPTSYIQQFLDQGMIPIIAHPERYEWVHEDYELIRKWRDMGALMQVNRTSILSLDKIQQANVFAKKMLEDDLVVVVASDAHQAYPPRNPKLSDVYCFISERYGEDKARAYLIDTPKKILNIQERYF